MKVILQRTMLLFVICAVVAGAVGLANQFTEPVIKANADKAVAAAMPEMLPAGDSFQLMEVDGIPSTVTEVYKAANGAGYVMRLKTMGLQGEMDLIIGIDKNGLITGVKTLKHVETQGIGSKTADEPFRSQFLGKDSALEGVDTITGATVSSTAYIKAVKNAFDAFTVINGGEIVLEEDPVGLTPEKLARYYPGVSEFTEVKAGNTRGIICGDKGFVVFKKAPGHESTLDVAVLFDTDGNIIGVVLNEIADTVGVGMLCAESEFTSRFIGVDDPSKVDALTGATNTSTGVKTAVAAAMSAFESIKALA